MKQNKKYEIIFNERTRDLFLNLKEIQNEYCIMRLNGVILLKGLLEEKESILYNLLCSTCIQNPYKKIIEDCNMFLSKMKGKEERLQKSEIPFRILLEENVGIAEFYMDQEFALILQQTISELIQEKQEDPEKCIIIDTEDIFVTFMNDIPQNALTILKNNGVFLEAMAEYYSLIEEMYEEENYIEEQPEEIPHEIEDFVTVLNTKYKGISKCEILGRDKECQKVIRILQKRGRKNVILIGEPGVGKTSIAEKIAFDIANGNCPESMKNYMVLQVNINNSIAGTMYRGMAESRFKLLIDFLENHENVILFIDEIHMVIGAGGCSINDSNDMANALKPFLASKKSKVIGATTEKEYEKYFSKDEAFKRRFEKVIIKEPKSKEVYPMLKNAIEEHEKYHGVKISEEMVKYAVLISSCFNNVTNNPDRTNDLIDSAMVIAKEQGKEWVDKDSILKNFDINFEKFEKLEENEKRSTAYHEAGHYLVWRKSEKLKDFKGIAVSIMPAESYLGITVYDDLRDEVTVYPDKGYYIDYIANVLAGRVAEKIYTNSISSGASSDLEKANKLAYQLICEFGMSKQDENRIYFDDERYHMMSEKICNSIDEEVKEIMEEATKRANKIISENEKLLLKLVNALMEKAILDENDLEEICAE